MNRIAQKINNQIDKLTFSRELNNYVYNCKIDDNIKNQLKQLLAGNKLFASIENEFINILKDKYINNFLQLHPQYKLYFDSSNDTIQTYITNFIMRLEKKYLNEYTQKEIQNNLKYPINSKVNNLTFSSQDPYFREAPIVVCREFLDNGNYKDHVLIGPYGTHHEYVLNKNSELLDRCKLNGIDFFTCAFLYKNNIVYLSTNEYNAYSSLKEVANIIIQQYPMMNIFSVTYPKDNKKDDNKTKKITERLAKKYYASTAMVRSTD